ncbi:DUF5011 domain-containing protein [Alteromonas sp. IB21]|uniref:immunoglobulin-like domain-containing protein n=1 Tax=Alteromonas sp. IB21 TaxID=2779369 RepID=UPI0018E8E2F5|nr:immunoglobulin-like domain-containing protein [Alteromonas sp. IB21]MBJ2129055.1 DUF5011 domain-containing protein [Alteromonas sp. IB21]
MTFNQWGTFNQWVSAEPAGDTAKPVIILLGDASVTITEGDTYTDAGATASDNVDGDISGNIVVAGLVDTSTPATYIITYNVSDSAGNQADEVVRTVIVEAASTDAPISLASPVTDRNAYIDSAFSYDLTAFFDGTFTPFTYVLTGTLPDGLTFNASTGVISGTATTEEIETLTITATDANSNEVSDAFVITTKTLIPSVNIGATGLIRPTLRETLRS